MKAKEKVQGFVTVEEAIEMDYETTKELQLKHLNRELWMVLIIQTNL